MICKPRCRLVCYGVHTKPAIFTQLDDVQQDYTMDEIRFEEKHEDLLGRYKNERDSERKQYEVGYSYVILLL